MNRKKTGQSSFTVGDSLNWANENVAGSNRQYAIGDKVIAGNDCVKTGPKIVAMVARCASETYNTRKLLNSKNQNPAF